MGGPEVAGGGAMVTVLMVALSLPPKLRSVGTIVNEAECPDSVSRTLRDLELGIGVP